MKILILEDADYDAELIEYELGKLKSLFHFRRAVTREQFLQALEEFSPDLILADYRLPAFDGPGLGPGGVPAGALHLRLRGHQPGNGRRRAAARRP